MEESQAVERPKTSEGASPASESQLEKGIEVINVEDEAVTTEPEEEDLDKVKILYAYCGEARKGDIKDCLMELSRKPRRMVEVVELDLCRSSDHDLSNDEYVQEIIIDISIYIVSRIVILPNLCN